MSDDTGLADAGPAELFERHRGHLQAVAYRMLGSLPEADDAAQEAWLRFAAAGTDGVENPGGWLTTIVTRVCLNVLRARASRPEQRAVVDAFFAAARAGNFDRLVELLHPDAVVRADGGTARPGASVVMRGAAEIARATIATASPLAVFSPVVVNGVAGILITFRGRPVSLIACTVSGGRITALDGITDLDRLRHLGLDRLAQEG